MKILFFLRSCVMTVVTPISVIVMGSSAMLCHVLFNNRRLDDWHIHMWGVLNYRVFGVRIRVTGLENIPDSGCLFLFNHSSFFDIFALCGALPSVRFGAKAELFKIPVFAQAMKTMGTLPIARQNREEVYKIYEDAKLRLKIEKFALSPEGGRFYGPHLSPFKAGPFLFAMSAEAPVVPVVILGAYECLPKGSMIPNADRATRLIEVHILKPISTIGYEPSTRQKLQAEVYTAMDPIWAEDYLQRRN